MKRTFTARITKEGDCYIAQCLEVDIASQGDSEEDAVNNLGEAVSLYLTSPAATACSGLRSFEVEIEDSMRTADGQLCRSGTGT